MKSWVKKIAEQFEAEFKSESAGKNGNEISDHPADLNDERATLLFILDCFSKHLIEMDMHPVRRVRDTIDNFMKQLMQNDPAQSEKLLFNIRQFFSSYRIDEYSYMQNTIDDFKKIIWEFADHLAEDLAFEKLKDQEAKKNLDGLREAVEANSINELKARSKEFIDFYVRYQTQKQERRTKSLSGMKKNLTTVKKQLTEANVAMRTDHMTGAFNRKYFDEHLKNFVRMSDLAGNHVTLLMFDIDFFKKINDNYGHDVGDFCLKECVRMLKETFARENDIVARIGGEEFAVILPDFQTEQAEIKAREALEKIRKEVFVHNNQKLSFTVSIGVAEHFPGETSSVWLKRADMALYNSKQTGRNKYTVAPAEITPLKLVP